MEAKAKINQVESNLDKINIFCLNILKHDTKLRYFESKVFQLKEFITSNKQPLKNNSLQSINVQDLNFLIHLNLNPLTISALPCFKLIALSLINLLALILTMTHIIFFKLIESFHDIFPAYIYSFCFFFLCFIAGLFFRARRVKNMKEDILWSIVSLLTLLIAYFPIQCLFFHYENFPAQLPLIFLKQPDILFDLFFNLPSSLILQFFWACYLIIGFAIFYAASYLFFGSPEVAKIVARYPEVLFSAQDIQHVPLKTPSQHFNIKKVNGILKSYEKFQEKLITDLESEPILETVELDEIQKIELNQWEILQEKFEYLLVIYSDDAEINAILEKTQLFIQQNYALRIEFDLLQQKIITLDYSLRGEV